MRRITFNKKNLDALAPEKRTVYHDAADRKSRLGLLALPTGAKSFFWFKRVNGDAIWKTIGAYPYLSIEQARDKANDYNKMLENWRKDDYSGPNPFKYPKGVLTLGELFDEYYKTLKTTGCSEKRGPATAKSLKNIRGWYDSHLQRWKDRKLQTIQWDRVNELHKEITKDNGPVVANRVVGLLRACINWAMREKKWTGTNPAEKIKKNHEERRDRFVQPGDEMTRLLQAIENERGVNWDLHDFVLLSLFCGQRKSNTLAMRWEQITVSAAGDFAWRIPVTKNGKPHVVPMLPEALKVLQERKQRAIAKAKEDAGDDAEAKISAWVFPSDSEVGHIKDMKKSWDRLRKEAKIVDVRIHDLRRTLGSFMAGANVSLPIVGKALGHQSLAATQVYAHLQLDPVRHAMALAVAGMNAKQEGAA
jgi:integrase